MDFSFLGVEPSAAERDAVDGLLRRPDGKWMGVEVQPSEELRVVRGGAKERSWRHLLLPALNCLQSEIGWLSREALDYVCRRLFVPPAEAYGVATFYSLLATEERSPKIAHVCDDIACRSSGAVELMSGLKHELGPPGVDVDGVAWMTSPCLGQCDRAPAVYFQLAGERDDVMSRADTSGILGRLRGGCASVPILDLPQSGYEELRLLRRISQGPSLTDYRALGGYAALSRALDMGSAWVVEEIKVSGLRGRGGAAFPTGLKWEAVAGAAELDRYVICNADESEPGTFKDRVLMEGDPFAVVEAMTIAGVTVGARRGYLYIRGEYPIGAVHMEVAVAEARSARLLGDNILESQFSFDIEIRRGAGAYICGEETALMNSIEGYRGEPRNKPPFPTEKGLFGKPTLINNVETLVNILDIVLEGGDVYATVGTPGSTGPRLFCLSGAVARPGVYEVPMGTTLGALIGLAGGSSDGEEPSAILLGGAAGSFVTTELLDMPLTFEDASERGVSLGSGVVMLFDQHTDFTETLRRMAEFFRDESCGQCVPCRVGTVRQEELLASSGPIDVELLAEIEQVMTDASICGLGHTAAIAIRSAIDLQLV